MNLRNLNSVLDYFQAVDFEILDNFVLILEVLEALSDFPYFQNIEFNFAIVNALSFSRIRDISKRKWLYIDTINEEDCEVQI